MQGTQEPCASERQSNLKARIHRVPVISQSRPGHLVFWAMTCRLTLCKLPYVARRFQESENWAPTDRGMVGA